jgi:hypothetical protein
MQSIMDFHEDFMAMIEVIKEYGGTGLLTFFPNMIKKKFTTMNVPDVASATSLEKAETRKIVREKFLAMLMLNGANGLKCNDLKRSMSENYVTGTSKYPESPEVVLRILNAYQPPPGWNQCKQESGATKEQQCLRRLAMIPGRQI